MLFRSKLHQVKEMRALTVLQFFIDTDAIRQPQRFNDFLSACECDIRGRTGYARHPFPEADVLKALLQAVEEVDAGAVAKLHTDPGKLKQAVFEARLAAIELALSN